MKLDAEIKAKEGRYLVVFNLHDFVGNDRQLLHRYGTPKVELPNGSPNRLEFHQDINVAVATLETQEAAKQYIQDIGAKFTTAIADLRKQHDHDSGENNNFTFEA